MARLPRGHLPLAGERSHVSSQLVSRRVVGRDARPGAAAGPVAAPSPKPSSETALFKGLQYRLVGPSRGGRVTTVTGVPSQPRPSTWASRAAACSGRPTAARPGCRSPTARSRSDRWERSRSPIPIRTSSTSAPAPTACAATSRPAAASTRRPTAARPGSSPASTTPARSARVRIHPTNPDIVWVAADGRHLQAERRARRLQDDRRRQDVEEDAVRHRQRRRDGRRAAAGQPERRLRLDVAARAQAVDDHQRLEGRRLLQEHGRRRDVHEDHDRPARRADRQGQPRRHRRQAGSHLRADRSASRAAASIARTTRGQTWALRQPAAGR